MTTVDVDVDRPHKTAPATTARRRIKAERLCAELLDRVSTLEVADLARISVGLLAEVERRRRDGQAVNLVPVLLADDTTEELEYWAHHIGLPVPAAVERQLRWAFGLPDPAPEDAPEDGS